MDANRDGMEDKIFVAMAGNTMGAAFAVLKSMGFRVTHVVSSEGKPTGIMRAENRHCVLQAEDPVLLLGLAQLVEKRGAGWRSTGLEVDEFLGFQAEVM
jgi:hypothetical protein